MMYFLTITQRHSTAMAIPSATGSTRGTRSGYATTTERGGASYGKDEHAYVHASVEEIDQEKANLIFIL